MNLSSKAVRFKKNSAAEINTDALFHGRQWGRWTFDAERLVLVLDAKPITQGDKGSKYLAYLGIYEVDIERIRQSSHMLDWIFQIRTLGWVNAKCMSDFLQAMYDIFRPQGTLCSCGMNKVIENPTAFLRRKIQDESVGRAA